VLLATASSTAAQPVTVTLVMRSGERHSGQDLYHRFDKVGGEVALRKSLHDQLRVAPDQVAYIDFGGTPDVQVTLSGSQRAVVLRSGTIVRGQIIEMTHADPEDRGTPYLVIIRDERGQERRFPAGEVARVYFVSTPPAPVAKPKPVAPRPAAGGGFVVSARQVWTSTGIVVERGETVRFATTGQIQLSADGEDIATPAGSKLGRRAAPGAPIPDTLAGALIGRIGTDGRPFGIGDQRTVPMPAAGILFLGVNDDSVNDNRGEFRVEIERDLTPIRRRR
jgi:hypothetical protein